MFLHNKKRGVLLLVFVLIFIIISETVFAADRNADTAKWPKMIKIGSSSPCGYLFSTAYAYCEILNDAFQGINVTPTSGGNVSNLKNCDSNEFPIALGCNYTELDAFAGNHLQESG